MELSYLERPPVATARAASVHPSVAPPVGAARSGILALVGAGTGGTHAAWRAALVARDLRRPLNLATLEPHPGSAAEAQRQLDEVAFHLHQRLRVGAQAADTGLSREQLLELASRHELVVVPWPAEASWFDRLVGTWPERLLRRLTVPLLVVRRPPVSGYRRVLVPVKLQAGAERQIGAALRMAWPRPVRVLHVVEPGVEGSLRSAGVSERAVSLHRQMRVERAHAGLNGLVDRSGARPMEATTTLAFGQVPDRVCEAARAHGAQLVVLGTTRRSAVGELLCGGVVQDLLWELQADLLVIPEGAPSAPLGSDAIFPKE